MARTTSMLSMELALKGMGKFELVLQRFNALLGNMRSICRVLKNFKIGKFAREKDSLASDGPSGIVKDFRALNVKYRRMGLFKSSKLYYVYKILTNMTLLSGACGLMLSGLAQQSIFGYLLSSFLLALFWQQMGWLAHDFLHNQVTNHFASMRYFASDSSSPPQRPWPNVTSCRYLRTGTTMLLWGTFLET